MGFPSLEILRRNLACPVELALAQPTLGEGLDQVAYRGPSQPILACDPMIYTTALVMTAHGEQPNRFLQYFQP